MPLDKSQCVRVFIKVKISDWIHCFVWLPLIAFDLQAVSSMLKQRLSDEEEYVHVYPLQLYQDHPGYGVRDIANSVLSLLRKVITSNLSN